MSPASTSGHNAEVFIEQAHVELFFVCFLFCLFVSLLLFFYKAARKMSPTPVSYTHLTLPTTAEV